MLLLLLLVLVCVLFLDGLTPAFCSECLVDIVNPCQHFVVGRGNPKIELVQLNFTVLVHQNVVTGTWN